MAEARGKGWKRAGIAVAAVIVLLLLAAGWFSYRTRVEPPVIVMTGDTSAAVENPAPDFFRFGKNWLSHDSSGLWIMYTEGSPFMRGVAHGKLARELMAGQEQAFIDRIRTMIPSASYLRFLRYFIYWFNRDLDRHIPEEYREEIYGVSRYASAEYDLVGPAYQRMLNYHSAHDIGHALQDYQLAGCTSFATWSGSSADSTLLVGRNFDFFMGDAFARNKIVHFVRPDSGYGFMIVTWAGMTGAVSGMNECGLTVTINAARSEVPFAARTPISILAREILQYAANLEEAHAIADARETFVSESILVGSAADRRAAIIEKSPSKTVLLEAQSDHIVCANHFQSKAFASDPLNRRDMQENASVYRQNRLLELLTAAIPIDPQRAAGILRDRKGLRDEDIGLGNEKAMNQLIAHHAVIFQPEKRLAWISTGPWQCGEFICFDLSELFSTFAPPPNPAGIKDPAKIIPPDPFLDTREYRQFLGFRAFRDFFREHPGNDSTAVPEERRLEIFRGTNPRSYEVYETTGDLYARSGQAARAREAYRTALGKVVPRWSDKERIIKKMVQLPRPGNGSRKGLY